MWLREFGMTLTTRQASSCYHVFPCPGGSAWWLYKCHVSPHPWPHFSCFLLTTVSVRLSLVSLPWLCSCVTVSSVRGADVGGARRRTRTCINSSCGAQRQAASGKDSSARQHPALCNHCSPSQHEKGQLPLHIFYRRTALEHFVMTASLLICIIKQQGDFKHAKSCWIGFIYLVFWDRWAHGRKQQREGRLV